MANQSKRATILHHATARSADLFSAEALQRVVLPLKKKSPQHEQEEPDDPIGDYMTLLLNSHPDFRYDPARLPLKDNDDDNDNGCSDYDGFTYSPLFCRRNWRCVQRFYRRVRSAQPMTLPLSVVGFCYEKSPSRQKLIFILTASLLLFVSLLTAGLSFVLVTSHVVLLWSCREASFLLLQFAMLLVDWRELDTLCPTLKYMGWKFMIVCRWIDRHILLRRYFAGREWNADDFEFLDTMKAQSRHIDLWDLPPPCVEEAGPQLCLNHRYMARDEWSQATSKHIVAINFSYLMMKEEHIRKRARRSTVFHQQRSPSLPSALERTSMARDSAMRKEQYEEDEEHEQKPKIPPTNHRQVMSMSTRLGDHTERVFGLTTNSPSGGIELVREKQDSEPDMNSSQIDSFTIPTAEALFDSQGLIPETPTHIKSDSDSCKSSVGSCSSAVVADMNWMDISARIGMRVLNSAHLQRVVASQEAAERLKNITEKFVVSPRENGRNIGFDFTSPAGIQSLKAMTSFEKSTVSRMPKSMSRSPCRPVHSMWTSAAAAGVCSGDDDDSFASDGLGWNESKSSEGGDEPTAPPRIIRRRLRTTSMSPFRDMDDQKHLTIAKLSTDDSDACEVIHDTILQHEEQSFEILDSSHSFLPVEDNGRSCSYSYGASQIDKVLHKREPLAPGVKVAAPIFPHQPGTKRVGHSNYQMATVVSSKRVYVGFDGLCSSSTSEDQPSNCLSVTCKIDKSFLRNGEFAEVTFRVMDDWSSRYMPKHSKVPIGACVATSFGVGVVVGWRVEDDCHVIRSLWQRRGDGAAHAYLTRDAIHGVVKAAVGFDVSTKCGSGKVIGYVDCGRNFLNGRYIVTLKDDGVYKNCVVVLDKDDVYSCYGAQFIPVIEHIKEACDYQIQLDNYEALIRQQKFSNDGIEARHPWKFWSENLDILWNSFLKAVEEDSEFDEGVDNFMGSVIEFLERLDRPSTTAAQYSKPSQGQRNNDGDSRSLPADRIDVDDGSSTGFSSKVGPAKSEENDEQENEAGFWILNDIFGGIFQASARVRTESSSVDTSVQDDSEDKQRGCMSVALPSSGKSDTYRRAFAVIRTLMRTVSLARAASAGKPQLRLALSICREFLMFVRTLIKVQQKNVSPHSLMVWRNALEEIVSTFGPIKERTENIFRGIAQRMEQQGRKAKIKVMRFADSILGDELFLNALCQGEWKQCLLRIEDSMVKAKIIDEASCGHYRKTVRFIYEHIRHLSSKESGAAERNSEKLQKFLKLIQLLASPKRSILKFVRNDDVLEILERILVRVFCREEVASRMLIIHASNFKSLRHLRTLKDLSVAGRLWIPLLDAADEEFSYVVSRMPEHAKELMCPLSSIFSLCVAQFHKISAGNLTKDWLDFLMEDDGVRIIHEIDMKLILALSSFSRDIREVMEVLPYYPSIDDDILNLIDEVELDKFLKEASEAIDDADKLSEFIRVKAGTAVERFLAYLPKLSVPVERRDLGDGWVLTCHGQDGGDLTLSDVKVKRENLVCEVMGGDALFLPIFGEDETTASRASMASEASDDSNRVEESILDHIREMIEQAQRHGSWTAGIGGVEQPPSDRYVCQVLRGLPVTSVLNCAIDLWRNLEIDDDELLEIAIRDVSYQIQLHKELEEKPQGTGDFEKSDSLSLNRSSPVHLQSSLSGSASFEEQRNRFNPRIDPTVLYLKIKNLTLNLERFCFRIEKAEKRTIFDPLFEGRGAVSIENLCIVLRVECARERIGNVGSDLVAPVLILRELEVEIENVILKVQDTGADWLLNKAVKGFSDSITSVVESNLKEQVQEQMQSALEQLNSYFHVNPDILVNLLGITMDDLEEHIVFV